MYLGGRFYLREAFLSEIVHRHPRVVSRLAALLGSSDDSALSGRACRGPVVLHPGSGVGTI